MFYINSQFLSYNTVILFSQCWIRPRIKLASSFIHAVSIINFMKEITKKWVLSSLKFSICWISPRQDITVCVHLWILVPWTLCNIIQSYLKICPGTTFNVHISRILRESYFNEGKKDPFVSSEHKMIILGEKGHDPMTKPPTPNEKSNKQCENTKNATETSITQRVRTDLGRSFKVTATPLVWLNRFTSTQPSH